MPIENYSVLVGDPISGQLVGGRSAHFRITVNLADNIQTQVDVNVQSTDGSEVLYCINQAFTPPAPDLLAQLAPGYAAVPSQPGGLALDFVRSRVNDAPMVTQDQFALLPVGNNDMQNQVVEVLNQAIADAEGTVYVFGSAFSDPNGTTGIHNIHMNQGNPGSFERDNGVWQDGALFISLPATNSWTAVFIAFQTESWNTDPTNGDPL